MSENTSRLIYFFIGLGSFFLAFYVLGYFFPETFWASHNLKFLPGWLSFTLFAISICFLLSPLLDFDSSIFLKTSENGKSKNRIYYAGISLLATLIFYLFPLPIQCYGDSLYIAEAIDGTIDKFDSRLITELFTPGVIDTKVGLKTFYEITNLQSYLTGMNGKEVAILNTNILGGAYCFLWMLFCDKYLSNLTLRWTMIFVGITAPFTQVFMGHIETYSYSYIAIIAWFTLLGVAIRSDKKSWYFLLPIGFFLLLQTHITHWIYFPGLLFVLLSKVGFKITWRKALLFYIIPVCVAGVIAYFFIYANHDGPRKFTKDEFESTLFLPLYTDEPPPYDRYNLLSLSHIWDYFSLGFIWSAALLFLLIPLFTFFRRIVPWKDPFIILSGTGLILSVSAYFFLNPLLGLQDDWDLFAMPALTALPFLVYTYSRIAGEINPKLLVGPAISLCLIGLSFQFSNSSKDALSGKLHSNGMRKFKTYWIGASTSLIQSAELLESEAARSKQILKSIEDTRPYAIQGNDTEFAGLLQFRGEWHLQRNENADALKYFEEAYSYSPLLGKNLEHLVAVHFQQEEFDKAFVYMGELVSIRYQPFRKTLLTAIQVALAAHEYQAAADYSLMFTKRWKDNETVIEIERRLRTGDNIETIIDLFETDSTAK